MENNHLTDQALQAYALNDRPDDTSTIHLAACTNCHEKLEAYQDLMANLPKISAETFPFDVTTLVMEKVNALETKKEKNTNTWLFMGLCAILFAGLALAYPYMKIIFEPFKSCSIMANVFMLVSALGVVIFVMHDQVRQYKRKEMLLSQ